MMPEKEKFLALLAATFAPEQRTGKNEMVGRIYGRLSLTGVQIYLLHKFGMMNEKVDQVRRVLRHKGIFHLNRCSLF